MKRDLKEGIYLLLLNYESFCCGVLNNLESGLFKNKLYCDAFREDLLKKINDLKHMIKEEERIQNRKENNV